MEQIVPVYRGKPQAEKLMFIYANTFYKLEDFYLAGYQFERFETSYPKSDSVEVAAYRSAKSYYQLSPRFSLDQKDTDKALEKLQAISINIQIPNIDWRPMIWWRNYVGNSKRKILRLHNNILRQSDFKPAIEAFENFISDHPGSEFRKDAFYGRLEAGYGLAINSVPQSGGAIGRGKRLLQ